MVIYRPGRLPRSGVARFEGGPADDTARAIQWPPVDVVWVTGGAYWIESYSDEERRAVYRWEPRE